MKNSLKNSVTGVAVTVLIILFLKRLILFPTSLVYGIVQFVGSLININYLTDFFTLCATYISYSITMALSIIIALAIFKTPTTVTFPFTKVQKDYSFLSITNTVSIGYIFNLVIILVVMLFSIIGIHFAVPPMPVYNNSFILIFDALLAGIIPALFEEMLFRGIIMESLRKHSNSIAIMLSALAFALCHNGFPQAIFAFLMGILFAIMTIRTGSLIPSIIAHAIYNFSGTLISGLIGQLNSPLSTILDALSYIIFFILAIVSYIELKNSFGRVFWYPNDKEDKITKEQAKEIFTSIPFIILLTVCFILFIKEVHFGV